jgi:hypothetical protein
MQTPGVKQEVYDVIHAACWLWRLGNFKRRGISHADLSDGTLQQAVDTYNRYYRVFHPDHQDLTVNDLLENAAAWERVEQLRGTSYRVETIPAAA